MMDKKFKVVFLVIPFGLCLYVWSIYPKPIFNKSLPQPIVCQSEVNKFNPLLADKKLGFISSEGFLSYKDPILKNHECVEYKNWGLVNHLTMCIYDLAQDVGISKQIKTKGEFEGDLVSEMLKALDMFPDAIVMDLGSNMGVFTIPAAAKGHDVIAVDALRSNHQLLHESLEKNNLTCRVTQIYNAVYKTRGQMEMAMHIQSIGRSSLSHTHDTVIGEYKISHKVNAICMNDLVPLVRGKTVFLKMDLEGFEDEALGCADQFFNAANVTVLQIEWWWQRKENGPSDFIKSFLTMHGMVPLKRMDMKTRLNLGDSRKWPNDVYWIKQ